MVRWTKRVARWWRRTMPEPVQRFAARLWKLILGIMFVWRVLIVLALCIVLVPLFVRHGRENNFYLSIVLPSVLVYMILSIIHMRLKRGLIKEWLESLSTRLFLGLCAAAAAFLFFGLEMAVLGNTLLVVAAVLYALVLSRIGLFKVIGL